MSYHHNLTKRRNSSFMRRNFVVWATLNCKSCHLTGNWLAHHDQKLRYGWKRTRGLRGFSGGVEVSSDSEIKAFSPLLQPINIRWI
jgi:hypothetical protein